jgi:hypothetical protein
MRRLLTLMLLLLSYSSVVFCQPTVSVYVDRDFQGAHADLKPGKYDLYRGQVPGVPNDSISSLMVPFGLSMRAFDDVGDDGNGAGDSETYEPGRVGFVGGT